MNRRHVLFVGRQFQAFQWRVSRSFRECEKIRAKNISRILAPRCWLTCIFYWAIVQLSIYDTTNTIGGASTESIGRHLWWRILGSPPNPSCILLYGIMWISLEISTGGCAAYPPMRLSILLWISHLSTQATRGYSLLFRHLFAFTWNTK